MTPFHKNLKEQLGKRPKYSISKHGTAPLLIQLQFPLYINSHSIIFQANECTFSCSDSHCCFSLFLNCRFYLSHLVNDEGFIIQDQYWKSLQIWHFLSPSYHSSNILSDLCSHNSINLYDWCYHIVF